MRREGLGWTYWGGFWVFVGADGIGWGYGVLGLVFGMLSMLMILLMRMCLRLENWRYENTYPEFFNL